MQVSGLSGSSAALALRELLQSQKATSQELPSDRQEMPSSGAKAMQGFGGAQMSSDILSSLMGMQMTPPSAADMATNMISNLDANGDRSLSLDEVGATSTDANAAFSTLDADGDGALSSDELTAAFEELGPPPGGPPPGAMGAPPSSSDIASDLLSDTDTDEDGALSPTEITEALGVEDSAETRSAFSALDSDGDGKLSLAELSAALDQYLKAGAERFATQAAKTAASI